jgi:hypothetical protein
MCAVACSQLGGMRMQNVILVTTDGLRWQDVFTGADPELMNKQNGGLAGRNHVRSCTAELDL